MTRSARFLPVLPLLLGSLISAHALPGEADAVIRFCGTPPGGESREPSQVTGHTQRSFLYNNLILHFEPDGAGWTFTTAWHGHLPMSRATLERKLPCFRQAMQSVATSATPLAAEDPTIEAQSTPKADSNTFGIAHFWVIVTVIALFFLLLLIPTARARRRRVVKEIPFADPSKARKPSVDDLREQARAARRHPDLDDV